MSDDRPETESTAPAREERSLLPAVLGGAGILAIAALLVFWPTTEKARPTAVETTPNPSASQHADDSGAPGGVQARAYDDPSRAPGPVKVNPAIRLPAGIGMAPSAPAPEPPPTFETEEEEIAWVEQELEKARKMAEFRKQAVERLPKIRESMEKGPNREEGLRAWEKRKEIVEDNLEKAEQKVSELEKRLADLRK